MVILEIDVVVLLSRGAWLVRLISVEMCHGGSDQAGLTYLAGIYVGTKIHSSLFVINCILKQQLVASVSFKFHSSQPRCFFFFFG